jgi:hypothetical protein
MDPQIDLKTDPETGLAQKHYLEWIRNRVTPMEPDSNSGPESDP